LEGKQRQKSGKWVGKRRENGGKKRKMEGKCEALDGRQAPFFGLAWCRRQLGQASE